MKIASLSDKGSIERSENRAFNRTLVGEAGCFHLKVRAMWIPGYIFTTSKLCTLWNYFFPFWWRNKMLPVVFILFQSQKYFLFQSQKYFPFFSTWHLVTWLVSPETSDTFSSVSHVCPSVWVYSTPVTDPSVKVVVENYGGFLRTHGASRVDESGEYSRVQEVIFL